MEENSPKRTAFKVAMMRAAHQIIDHPVIFEDPLALKLAGKKYCSRLKSEPFIHNKGLNKNFRAIVTARSRFVEDELKDAYEKGVRKYFILGAGFDTFAYRNPYGDLSVFEVDFPSTQDWKLNKLKETEIEIPHNLKFIPVDFESDNLMEKLREFGLTKEEPVFFSWLGVSMYLEKDTMMKTLKLVSNLAKGSCIVFDYVVPVSSGGMMRKIIYLLIKRRLKLLGEPWINFLNPSELKRDLENMGFGKILDLGPDEINSKFFSGRKDGLKAGQAGHILIAEV